MHENKKHIYIFCTFNVLIVLMLLHVYFELRSAVNSEKKYFIGTRVRPFLKHAKVP